MRIVSKISMLSLLAVGLAFSIVGCKKGQDTVPLSKKDIQVTRTVEGEGFKITEIIPDTSKVNRLKFNIIYEYKQKVHDRGENKILLCASIKKNGWLRI